MKRNEKSQSATEYLLLMGMVVSAIWMFCRPEGPLFNIVNENPGGPGSGGPGIGIEGPETSQTNKYKFTIPTRPVFGAPGGLIEPGLIDSPLFHQPTPDSSPNPELPSDVIGKQEDHHKMSRRKKKEILTDSTGQFIVESKTSGRSVDPATELIFVKDPSKK